MQFRFEYWSLKQMQVQFVQCSYIQEFSKSILQLLKDLECSSLQCSLGSSIEVWNKCKFNLCNVLIFRSFLNQFCDCSSNSTVNSCWWTLIKCVAYLWHHRKTVNQWTERTGRSLQMNWLSLRNNWLKFKITGKLLIILEKLREYTSN